MAGEPTLRDWLLGLEGLGILRAWMLDPAAVRARVRSIVELAGSPEGAPWSEPFDADERSVSDGYAEWASTYDDPGNPMFLAEEPVVHGLLARYPAGDALDAACGTGRHAAHLASLGHRVVGIDLSPQMLEAARAKAPGARFETADLAAIPLPDGGMDLAVCSLALTHCADLGPPVREIARVVRSGGRVVISDVHPFMAMLGAQARYRRNPTEHGFVRNHTHLASDYLAAFREAGLDVVRCIEPLWGDREITGLVHAQEMRDLLDAAIRGCPIVIVWELEKGVGGGDPSASR